jgi:L-threonylcarbamoyladenylate synthase
MTQISSDISKAIELLNKEDVVAIPTETVYGLAGNIYSEKAIRKIFEVKQRPLFNPLIVHIPSIDQLEKVAREFPIKAQKLAEAFWPGSLTLILPKKLNLPEIVTGGKDTVGVRIPNHPVTLSLLKQVSFPLAAPSANPYNRISPTSSDHVKTYFGNILPMVLEGGECKNGIESTIIGFENNEAILYRLGAISVEDIEKIIGNIQIKNKTDTTPNAPGMVAKHYAPKTKMYLLDDIDEFIENTESKKIGVLRFQEELNATRFEHIEILSKSGDLKEATSKLYAALHKLDSLDLDIIVAERFPDVGLGKSINDRLERAIK